MVRQKSTKRKKPLISNRKNSKHFKKISKKTVEKKIKPVKSTKPINPVESIKVKNSFKSVKKQGFFSKLKEDILGRKKDPEKENTKQQIKELKPVSKELKKEIVKKHFEKLDKLKKPVKDKEKKGEYVKTGIKGFDALFDNDKGIPSGTSILVEGGPGSGKTLFCLNTVYNLCRQGKKCLYMSFEEPEENLIHHMENFGWDVKKLIKKGNLRITRFDAIDVSRSIEALLSAAKKELMIEVDPVFFPEDFKPDFVVMDSLTSISSAFSGEESRFRIYMEQLFRYLERHNMTNFLVREVSSPSHIGTTFKESGEAVSFLSDGIIVIYNVIYDSGERSSAIEILKMRGVSFDKKIVELKIIDKKGIEINPKKILDKTKGRGFKLT